MNCLKEMCCLCLSDSNSPFINFFSKSQENSLTFYEKISYCLTQLALVLTDKDCKEDMICNKCSNTIEVVYKFNIDSLQNVEIFASQKEIFNAEINKELNNDQMSNEVHLDDISNDVKKEVENIMDICQVDMLIDEIDSNWQNENQDAQSKGGQNIHQHSEDYIDLNALQSNIEGEFYLSHIAEENQAKVVAEMLNKNSHLQCESVRKVRNAQIISKMEKRYVCLLCDKAFRNNYDLGMHERSHSGAKPYACEICNRSFSRKDNLQNHQIIHTDKKAHACDVCQKTFKHKVALDRHKLIHTGQRPFCCTMCDKKFYDVSHLARHKRLHTGEKPFICRTCNTSFLYKYQLQKHVVSHANKIENPQTSIRDKT